jgi:hypothetical protein
MAKNTFDAVEPSLTYDEAKAALAALERQRALLDDVIETLEEAIGDHEE